MPLRAPVRPRTARPRVGLVLGAGGITGIAWLAGALRALREHGYDPADADLIAGTSAGAVAATVLAAGHDPCDLLAFAEDPGLLREAIVAATAGRGPEGLALPLPGSLGLASSSLLRGGPRGRLGALTGLLPRGVRSSDEIRGLTHAAARSGWPADRRLWLHTWDVRAGRLVTFGRDGAPAATVADAVAASCAVPSYYRPVTIGGRRYVDGGIRSLTNADLLAGEPLDTVLVLTPFSARERGPLLDTAVYGLARTATAARTGRELDRLRAAGMHAALLTPAPADLRAMGLNPMDRGRSRRVLETAHASVAARLDATLDGVPLPAARRRRRRHLRLAA
ncbi:patatin [Conexibacter sp. W3-3-2]|uniref:patatin-like phospholipase family protein n=1 Tax=Conexibacter sp. W3-3-2 TaxID=2675227 RepID=UPI0012B8406D|nr:patatin-like phospholipase family protein [Conexibacter sp. W3-3-2]MTD43262.1 patatin [Conexibacter sp. W3-3-2]